MKTFIVTLALVTTMIAGNAFAQSAGATSGPTINGGVQMNVEAADDISAAIGNEAKSTQELGAIDSGSITGDTEMSVQAADDISAAIGNESCSDQKIGTIGAKAACK